MLRPLIPLLGLFISSTAAAEFHLQVMLGAGSGKICRADECGTRHTGSSIAWEFGTTDGRFTLGAGGNGGIHFNDDFHGQNVAEEGYSAVGATMLKAGVYLTPSILVQAGAGIGKDYYSVGTSAKLDKRVGLATGADISMQRWVKDNWAIGVRAQGFVTRFGEKSLEQDYVAANYSPGTSSQFGGGFYLHYMVDGGKKAEDEE